MGYFEVKGLRSRKYGDVGGRKKEENGGGRSDHENYEMYLGSYFFNTVINRLSIRPRNLFGHPRINLINNYDYDRQHILRYMQRTI